MNSNIFRRVASTTATLSAAVLVLAGCSGSTAATTTEQGFPDTITLASIPGENSTDQRSSYQPVIERLQRETGAKVDLVQASDYAGVVEGLIAGNVDIAFLGPFAYVVAGVNGAQMTPLGAVVKNAGATPGYHSYGIVRSDNSSVNSLADYAGRKVCFVDPSSTSGFLYPSAGLIEEGVVASGSEGDISAGVTPIYAGGHDASALAVKAGDCDAGFAFDTMVDRTMIDNGELQPGDLKTVWTSETIAGQVFVANNKLGTDAIDKLQKIFTESMNSDAFVADGICSEECRITDDHAWGVVPAKDSDYDGVRHVCDVTGSEKCRG